MRKLFILAALLTASLGASRAAAPQTPAAPEFLTVRAAATDASWKTATDEAWAAKVLAEVAAGVKGGADAIVFPEGFYAGRRIEELLPAVAAAAGRDRLVVFGHSPVREPGSGDTVSRAQVYAGGAWIALDKLDPTPAERAAKPPVKPGFRLILFRFRGGLVAVLPAYSIQKTEVAASLKKRALQLVLVSAPAEDEEGRARLERSAAGRAVELGAAVVIAPPAGAPSLHLPAQKGFDLKSKAPAGRDVRIPWRRLLEIRAPGSDALEPRPFADPQPAYQVEI